MSHNPDPAILITRPEQQAEAYQHILQREFPGITTVLSPLLAIEAVDVKPNLSGVGCLLFTSANAVWVYSTLTDVRNIPALCVGDKTSRAAVSIGLRARSAQGSVRELRKLAKEQAGSIRGELLHVRGQHIAKGLDLNIRSIVVYDQKELPLSALALRVLASSQTTVLPLFSPRTARIFSRQTAGVSLSNTIAVCISENVKSQIEAARFLQVRIAGKPNAKAVTREIAAVL